MTEKRSAQPFRDGSKLVMKADRAGSSWYVGAGFFFAPVLALVAPWHAVTVAIWVAVALAGLWLGVLGIAMPPAWRSSFARIARSPRTIGARSSTTR